MTIISQRIKSKYKKEISEWCRENLSNNFRVSDFPMCVIFSFETREDYMLFRLTGFDDGKYRAMSKPVMQFTREKSNLRYRND